MVVIVVNIKDFLLLFHTLHLLKARSIQRRSFDVSSGRNAFAMAYNVGELIFF